MTNAQMAMLAAGGVLVIVSFVRNVRVIRGGLALAGLLGLYSAIETHRPIATWIAALLVVVNVVQLALIFAQRRKVSLSEEESRMAERVLARMNRTAQRQLLDQGVWIEGRPGETLIRQGEPTPHLFYLSEGDARVSRHGHEIATCGPGHFLGEITVLSGLPATATVTLATRARFWCVTAEALTLFLEANPDLRPRLESAFVGDVAEKLRLANERLAEAERV